MFDIFDPHMPKEEKDFIRENYSKENNKIILEFGSGGSTFIALDNNKTVLSVETDLEYQNYIIKTVNHNNLAGTFIPIHINIGPTKKWGYPKNNLNNKDWINYTKIPIKLVDDMKLKIDLVLIDGRFRVATFLACLLYLKPPFKIIFDDYKNRQKYHIVEKFFKIEMKVGRISIFNINRNINSIDMNELFKYYSQIPD